MFGSKKATDVLIGQIKVLQDEKRELWDKIFALIARNMEEYHFLKDAGRQTDAVATSSLYDDVQDDEYKVGEIVEGQAKDQR